jgi:thymidylate kinase
MKNTLVVNLIGGQGAGKTSTMEGLTSWLKWRNVEAEMCSEFAKELIYENRKDTFKDEMYIFAKQSHRLFRCNGKVDIIVTDRPLIMSVVYNQFYGNKDNILWNNAYEKLVVETFNQYDNYNIYLNRVKPYNPNGRNETEETARKFDILFKKYLDDSEITYDFYDGCEESIPIIGEQILKILNKSQNIL